MEPVQASEKSGAISVASMAPETCSATSPNWKRWVASIAPQTLKASAASNPHCDIRTSGRRGSDRRTILRLSPPQFCEFLQWILLHSAPAGAASIGPSAKPVSSGMRWLADRIAVLVSPISRRPNSRRALCRVQRCVFTPLFS
eukprot:scaffold2201_cov240-Pinguiococcus_pyrenoidosus.AAC.15